MQQFEQTMENQQNDDFSEKLEKAKKIYCLLNNITFGDEIESAKSRIVLQRIA